MKYKGRILAAFGFVMLLAGMTLSIYIGAKSISANEIYNALFAFDGSLNAQLIRDVRLPRVISAALVGGMLSLTGAMMQGVLRNPIAEPSIMGVTQGATLAVAVTAVSPLISGAFGTFFAALIGAFISGILIFLFTMQSSANRSISKILLAGTAMSTFFLSTASVVALLGNRSQELAFWVAGGLRQTGWVQVAFLVSVGGIFSVLSLLMSRNINLIALGDETASGLGVNVEKTKFRTVFCLIPICGVCVAAAGNIGFLGLFVPHILRKIVGSDYRKLMPLSFLYGSVILVFADILARAIMQPYELPVGLFTAVIGVPVFLFLVRKENR